MNAENPTTLLTALTEKLRAPAPMLATLATIAADGFPAARTVVLRYVDDEEPGLYLSTHAGAEKVNELRRDPRGTLVLWLAEKKIQLRLSATWSILDATSHQTDSAANEIRDMMWSIHSTDSRQMFSWPPPGKPVEASQGYFENRTFDDPKTPAPAFAILHGVVHAIDALHITKPLHIRYQHIRAGNEWKTLAVTP